MYDLFTGESRHYGTLIQPAGFSDVVKKTRMDIETIRQYYRRSSNVVKNTHLLVRLINAMRVPLHYGREQYYEVAFQRSKYIVSTFQLFNSEKKGIWQNGHFQYKMRELLISHSDEVRPIHLENNWQNLEPVRYLHTPVSNMNYLLPDGQANGSEEGFSVILIDIPMLMMQWRSFYLREKLRAGEQGEMRGVTAFIAQYVLPNMLMSQTDHAIQNRLFNLFEGAPMGAAYRKHPFGISDYTTRLDRGLQEVIARYASLDMEYETVLKQLPFVYNHAWTMPDMAETRQVWWVLFLTRLRIMKFLWEIGGEAMRRRNRGHIAKLAIDAKLLGNENILKTHVPGDMLSDVQFFLRDIRAYGGR